MSPARSALSDLVAIAVAVVVLPSPPVSAGPVLLPLAVVGLRLGLGCYSRPDADCDAWRALSTILALTGAVAWVVLAGLAVGTDVPPVDAGRLWLAGAIALAGRRLARGPARSRRGSSRPSSAHAAGRS